MVTSWAPALGKFHIQQNDQAKQTPKMYSGLKEGDSQILEQMATMEQN